MAAQRVLVVGSGPLARATSAAVERRGVAVARIHDPTDQQLRQALDEAWRSVLVISHDDVRALRWALVAEHLRPGLPLVVTIFDRTIARQLTARTRNCTVRSLADVVVPSIAGPCVDPQLAALLIRGDRPVGLRVVDAQVQPGPVTVPGPVRRMLLRAESQLRPYGMSSRMLVAGSVGLVALLLLDTVLAMAAHHEGVVDAFYAAVKTVATVGPNTGSDTGAPWYKLVSAASILTASLLFVAFTAGLVNRMLGRRLAGIIGARTIPRRDHVIVVGLGQVGLRLCTTLRDLGVPVVAVERDADAPHVWLARTLRIPVVIGRGADRFVLTRLRIGEACSLAAVTSDDDENATICVAARGLSADIRLVLRAGDGDVSAETQALFAVGVVRDAIQLGAEGLAATALGHPAVVVPVADGVAFVE
jgi:voltage-gated potassium channel Kch